jgi:hypothetical protein
MENNRLPIITSVILLIIIMMIPITQIVITPKDTDYLNSPIFELGGLSLNEVFVDNAVTLQSEQLSTNWDFSNGTTGWIANLGTISVNNGILLFTSTTTGLGGIYQTGYIANNSYYINLRIKPIKNSNVILFLNELNYNLTPNLWQTISDIKNVNTTLLRVWQSLNSSETYELDYVYVFDIAVLKSNKQYSPLFNTTFDLMSDANIKTQMDEWVSDGLTSINIWLTYNAVGLDQVLSKDQMLQYYNLFVLYSS